MDKPFPLWKLSEILGVPVQQLCDKKICYAFMTVDSVYHATRFLEQRLEIRALKPKIADTWTDGSCTVIYFVIRQLRISD